MRPLQLQRYRVHGRVRITYAHEVDEEVDAESEDGAIDAVCDDLNHWDASTTETDVYAIKVMLITSAGPDADPGEDLRMRLLGMPMLPGFEIAA